MKNEYTKGEWTYRENPDNPKENHIYCRNGVNYQRICTDIRKKANANLIISATDMLEMLEMLLEGDLITDSSVDKEVEQLIAKARGLK